MWGVLVGVYVAGLLCIGGLIGLFPAGAKHRNQLGVVHRYGEGRILSKTQGFILFSWFILYGAVLIYLDLNVASL